MGIIIIFYRCHQIFSNHPDFYLMLSSKSPSIQSRERDITSQNEYWWPYMYFIKQILNTVSNSAIANTIYHSEVFSLLKGPKHIIQGHPERVLKVNSFAQA